jgi:hypothetical protein
MKQPIYLIVLGVALATANLTQAQPANAFKNQCDVLTHQDADSLAQLAAGSDSFWNDASVRSAYLKTLKGGVASGRTSIQQSHDLTATQAAVLLAGIVRHDLETMQVAFSENTESYFERKSVFPPLTMAASCYFADGVTFLLDHGTDPNAGSDVGAFNVALVNHDTVSARALLKAGYRIEANSKRCKSSKTIVNKNSAEIPDDLTQAVRYSECGTDAKED